MKVNFTKEEKKLIMEYISNGNDSSALNIILSKGNIPYEKALNLLNILKKLNSNEDVNNSNALNNAIFDNSQKISNKSISIVSFVIFIIIIILAFLIIFFN
ncbi:MAG: hypothetical protein N2319_09565 [Candidatus Kapabacteria bacterium]|nr:hypothetical protein [Candidatus Kapabacteria bacterium]